MTTLVRLTEPRPFATVPSPNAKNGKYDGYWIRIIPDERTNPPMFGVAALPVENPNAPIWLTILRPTKEDALKDMESGFEVDLDDEDLLVTVINSLMADNVAVIVHR